MENGPFIIGLPIKNMVIFHGKLLVITRGYIYVYIYTAMDPSSFLGTMAR